MIYFIFHKDAVPLPFFHIELNIEKVQFAVFKTSAKKPGRQKQALYNYDKNIFASYLKTWYLDRVDLRNGVEG